MLKPSYNIQQLRPCFRFYGSPFRSISDYSQEFGDKERKCYRKVFEKAAEEDWSKRGVFVIPRSQFNISLDATSRLRVCRPLLT